MLSVRLSLSSKVQGSEGMKRSPLYHSVSAESLATSTPALWAELEALHCKQISKEHRARNEKWRYGTLRMHCCRALASKSLRANNLCKKERGD